MSDTLSKELKMKVIFNKRDKYYEESLINRIAKENWYHISRFPLESISRVEISQQKSKPVFNKLLFL